MLNNAALNWICKSLNAPLTVNNITPIIDQVIPQFLNLIDIVSAFSIIAARWATRDVIVLSGTFSWASSRSAPSLRSWNIVDARELFLASSQPTPIPQKTENPTTQSDQDIHEELYTNAVSIVLCLFSPIPPSSQRLQPPTVKIRSWASTCFGWIRSCALVSLISKWRLEAYQAWAKLHPAIRIPVYELDIDRRMSSWLTRHFTYFWSGLTESIWNVVKRLCLGGTNLIHKSLDPSNPKFE